MPGRDCSSRTQQLGNEHIIRGSPHDAVLGPITGSPRAAVRILLWVDAAYSPRESGAPSNSRLTSTGHTIHVLIARSRRRLGRLILIVSAVSWCFMRATVQDRVGHKWDFCSLSWLDQTRGGQEAYAHVNIIWRSCSSVLPTKSFQNPILPLQSESYSRDIAQLRAHYGSVRDCGSSPPRSLHQRTMHFPSGNRRPRN